MDKGKNASQITEDVHVLNATTLLQTTWEIVSTKSDIGDMSIRKEEVDNEFQELFAQIYSETTLDEYIDFDTEIIASETAFDPTHIDW